ncbi:hypothetical protein E2320_011768 [Naja naja]|nr:hypothetical protein E2320_011768 [Naja naja]
MHLYVLNIWEWGKGELMMMMMMMMMIVILFARKLFIQNFRLERTKRIAQLLRHVDMPKSKAACREKRKQTNKIENPHALICNNLKKYPIIRSDGTGLGGEKMNLLLFFKKKDKNRKH